MNKDYCAREDYYDNNEMFCDKLAKGEDDIEYADEYGSKKVCEDNFGEWKASECKFSKDDRAKGYDVDFDHSMEEKGLWDDYTIKQRDKKLEKLCNKVEGEWTKQGCKTDSDGPKADKFNELVDKEPGATIQDGDYGVIPFQTPEPVIEGWGNTVSEEEPTKIDGLFEDELEREDVDKYCDASEDYKKHPKQCDRYYKIVEKLEEDIKKRVEEYNQNTPVEDRPVTCDGGMTYSAAGTVCGDS